MHNHVSVIVTWSLYFLFGILGFIIAALLAQKYQVEGKYLVPVCGISAGIAALLGSRLFEPFATKFMTNRIANRPGHQSRIWQALLKIFAVALVLLLVVGILIQITEILETL